MLSLLVLITAAYRGYGFTKLTICDFFAASDLLSHQTVTFPYQHHVLAALALGALQPALFPVGQQEEVSLRCKHEEEASRVPAGD